MERNLYKYLRETETVIYVALVRDDVTRLRIENDRWTL